MSGRFSAAEMSVSVWRSSGLRMLSKIRLWCDRVVEAPNRCRRDTDDGMRKIIERGKEGDDRTIIIVAEALACNSQNAFRDVLDATSLLAPRR
jgi:hypothetical protein